MILTETKPQFDTLSQEAQAALFQEYVTSRAVDLSVIITKPKTKGKRKKGEKQVKLTTEEYELLQKLGLI